MNFTLNQLRIYTEIVQASSVSKAAERLHLSQPAVSIQLKNFQSQFDIPLTEFVGRKLYITDFGKEIFASAQKILEELESINYRTQDYKGRLSGKLKIAVVSTGKYVIPYFLSGFLRQHEGVDLQLGVTNRAEVIQSLEANAVDFALVSVPVEKMKLQRLTLMQNQLYFVGNRQAPADSSFYNRKMLQSMPLIYREQGSGTRQVMEKFILQHKLDVQKKLELTSNEAVKQAILSGMGYSVMPLIGIKNELNNGDLRILPVRGFPIRSSWELLWLKEKGFSRVALHYLEYLEKEKEKIIQQQFSWIYTYNASPQQTSRRRREGMV